MAFALTETLLIATLTVIALTAPVRAGSARPHPVEAEDTVLSAECRVPAGRLYVLAPLRAVRTVVEQKRSLKVLALGSGGATTGSGAGSAPASYSVRLGGELQKALPAITVTVEQRELSGDITAQAVERISALVAEAAPDLVVWQVGTSDALAKADLDSFSGALNEVLEWLWSHDIDVVLVEPPFSANLAAGDHYRDLMAAIKKSARDRRVPLVLRSGAMEFLGQQKKDGKLMSAFQLSDLGARCIAEHVARTVALSLLETSPHAGPATGQGK